MAVIANELPLGTATIASSARQYSRVWQVISDTKINPISAIASAPVSIGHIFPQDPDARCVDISGKWQRSEDSQLIYLVTASYETRSGGSEDDQEDDNPLNDRPVKRWGSSTVRLPVRFTNAKPPVPIVNSVGAPFDPQPEEDFKILTYSYQVNQAVYNENRAIGFRGAINNKAITIGGVRLKEYQARAASIEASNGERNGVRFWSVSITIEIGDDWRLLIPDEGLRKIAPPDNDSEYPKYLGGGRFGEIVPVLDGHGNPVTKPVLLNGAGEVLAEGDDPVLLEFQTAAKPYVDFSGIGLPRDNNP